MLADVLKSMRPRQWVKNLIVFGALMFVPGAVREWECWLYTIGAFVAFCLVSGAIYLINDIVDKPKDIVHPRKKLRPIASGRLPANAAIVSAIISLIIGIALCVWIDFIAAKPAFPETSHEPYGLTGTALAYIALMFLYSFLLKREIILDVLILSIGFVLRAVAGGFALDVRISPWLLATTFFISLFLALGKRRGEIRELEEVAPSHRDVLDKYSIRLIDNLLVVCAAANIMSYSLYTFLHDLGDNSNDIASQTSGLGVGLMFTVPFVVYGIFRYLHLVFKHDLGASPDEVLTTDGRLIACVILWVLVVLFMLSLR
jgi:4-hydroxybenzoate polyprenyltransferase